MSLVGEREIHTQRRVAAFFGDALGYDRLGDWTSRPGNANAFAKRVSAVASRASTRCASAR